MQRLVYAPRAYVFLRSRQENKVYDVSDLVVGGNVQRNINQASTASVILKNKDFILSPRGQKPRFLPMDGITIWLQRIAGYPIQVFTGYLDAVPMYQMYPGNATITASCTIKRLMHTYFDPGVPAMLDWFARHGWAQNPQSGLTTNYKELVDTGTVGHSQTDGGFGNLLYNFLIEICGWAPKSILIGDLPPNMARQARQVYSQIQSQVGAAEKEFEAFMGKIMTIRNSHTDTTQNATPGETVKAIFDVASASGLDPVVLTQAALSLTSLNPGYYDNDSNSRTYGAGLFDIPPTTTPLDNKFGKQSGDTNTYDGKPLAEILDPQVATELFVKRLRKQTRLPKITDDAQTLADIFATAAGKEASRAALEASLNANRTAARKLVSTYSHNSQASSSTNISALGFASLINNVMPDNISWENALLDDEKSYAGKYHAATTANPRMAQYLWVAHRYDLKLLDRFSDREVFRVGTNVLGALDYPDTIAVSGPGGSMDDYAHWAGKYAKQVVFKTGNTTQVWQEGSKGTEASVNGGIEHYVDNVVYITAPANTARPEYVGNVSRDPLVQAPKDPNAAVTFSDVAQIGFNAAFAAQFNMPVNFIESMFLTGNKSMMNDIPVLRGVSDMAAASMRTFMSLPNGDFAAFYPDYFGAQGRKPYWKINDIEIMDMGIQLSDEPLSTHVYVTGATTTPGQINFINEIYSEGVVTIDKVFVANSFIAEDNRSALMDEAAALEFLKIYGARPLRKDMPTIRSHWFEFLYAWQLFMYQWAAQFQTSATFTFQPEIMAGGRIEFPQHNLQMFVETVNHTWDYTSGFQTTATLVAPSVTDNSNALPGMVLAGSIGGFGAVATGAGA